jgi:geranylgeranyl diphosphate synthase type II
MKPEEFESLRREIEQAIASLDLPNEPAHLYEPMRYIMGLGGKRVRPVLTLLACALVKGNWRDAMPQAMAVEIFHNFSLVHDDIMDRADVRRGLSTVHRKWNDNVAILSGDGMLVVAYQYLMKGKPEHLGKLAHVFSNTALEVCEGQQLDMDYALANNVGIDAYLSMIRRKTAVLLSGAMKLGAIVGGANDRTLEALGDFAENMGLAFQIRDDYLDSFGDHKSFGKKIGGDIAEGKRTWLTIKAFERANDAQRDRLTEAFEHLSGDERIAAVLALYKELGIQTLAEAEISRYSERSAQMLDAVEGDEGVKQVLRNLVAELMGRTR